MPSVETNITILENTDDSLKINFTITNLTNSDLRVLKRNTPLEGLKSDCLVVTVDGERVNYDGYFLKRAAPKAEEYIELKVGETLSNIIDVSKAYDVSRSGAYEIKFDDSNLIITPATHTRDFLTADVKSVSEVAPQEVSNQQVSVIRTVTDAASKTVGQQQREEDKKKVELKAVVKATLKAPKIVGGTPEQRKTVTKAHKAGYRYAKKAAAEVNNDNLYKLWFGIHTETREEKVKTVYDKVSLRMERITFIYRFDGGECDDTTYAYTTVGGRTIWLCTMFWESPDGGFDSRAGTMVHEHSHASADTDDLEYSRVKCKQLAISKPETAIKNADTYEFYSESFHTD